MRRALKTIQRLAVAFQLVQYPAFADVGIGRCGVLSDGLFVTDECLFKSMQLFEPGALSYQRFGRPDLGQRRNTRAGKYGLLEKTNDSACVPQQGQNPSTEARPEQQREAAERCNRLGGLSGRGLGLSLLGLELLRDLQGEIDRGILVVARTRDRLRVRVWSCRDRDKTNRERAGNQARTPASTAIAVRRHFGVPRARRLGQSAGKFNSKNDSRLLESTPMSEPVRCGWSSKHPLMIRYHDTEWGVPLHDERKLFEFLILDGAQAGLSWQTILLRRENYRAAFDDFDAGKMARYKSPRVKRLLHDPGIIRNRLKVQSAITNARAFLRVQDEFDSFDRYIWQFVGGTPRVNHLQALKQIPATSKDSDAMSKDLKSRGFSFVGSTICYAFMQAAGLVNDHLVTCFRHREVQRPCL